MEVVLVDQHHLHARSVKVFCKAQSAKSAQCEGEDGGEHDGLEEVVACG